MPGGDACPPVLVHMASRRSGKSKVQTPGDVILRSALAKREVRPLREARSGAVLLDPEGLKGRPVEALGSDAV